MISNAVLGSGAQSALLLAVGRPPMSLLVRGKNDFTSFLVIPRLGQPPFRRLQGKHGPDSPMSSKIFSALDINR